MNGLGQLGTDRGRSLQKGLVARDVRGAEQFSASFCGARASGRSARSAVPRFSLSLTRYQTGETKERLAACNSDPHVRRPLDLRLPLREPTVPIGHPRILGGRARPSEQCGLRDQLSRFDTLFLIERRDQITPNFYGRMFWFSRKKFVGSCLRLRARSRSYLASPYAARTRSCPSSPRKLT